MAAKPRTSGAMAAYDKATGALEKSGRDILSRH